jgi:hypothetical protein
LEIVDPQNAQLSEWSLAASWRASAQAGGSPGTGHDAPGDFNVDGRIDRLDLDLLCAAILAPESDAAFDLNRDGHDDFVDWAYFIGSIMHTTLGDANLDRHFDSSDLVLVFQAGEYEDATAGNSNWSEGDWNCDGDFTTADFVAVFQVGAYAV